MTWANFSKHATMNDQRAKSSAEPAVLVTADTVSDSGTFTNLFTLGRKASEATETTCTFFRY